MPIILPAHNKVSLDEYNAVLSKPYLVKYWNLISGTGTLTYSSTVSGEGSGRLAFTGVAGWELLAEIPINEQRGIVCNFNHQQISGAATVTIAVFC